MIDAVVTRFGFARITFGRDLPPSRLHRQADCGEAAARITWAVAEKTIAMITGAPARPRPAGVDTNDDQP